MKLEALDSFVQEMRAMGIRRLELSGDDTVRVIELLDTIPAPPPFDAIPTDFPSADPSKDPSLCAGIGCALAGGWHGTPYCRAHGLSAAGVRT